MKLIRVGKDCLVLGCKKNPHIPENMRIINYKSSIAKIVAN